jgi:hypothetical protein
MSHQLDWGNRCSTGDLKNGGWVPAEPRDHPSFDPFAFRRQLLPFAKICSSKALKEVGILGSSAKVLLGVTNFLETLLNEGKLKCGLLTIP